MAPGQPLRSRHDADACQGPALSQCRWPSLVACGGSPPSAAYSPVVHLPLLSKTFHHHTTHIAPPGPGR